MIDRIAYSLRSMIVAHKDHIKLMMIILIMIIVLLFIIFIILIIRSKKASYIKPIHTIKIDSCPQVADTTKPTPEINDEFKLPPFLYGLSEPFQHYFKGGSFSNVFFKAQNFVERNFYDKYTLPWFAVLGASHSGKTQLLDSLEEGLSSIHSDFDQVKPREHCYFSFFNDAVLLNLKGDFFLNQNNEKANDRGFRAFLLLLSRYRMKRPLNGIILTIPMTEIYGLEKLSMNDIQRRAIIIKEKLSALQEFLGIRLPVYIFFTKTDIIEGFNDFISALTPSQYHSSIGWSLEQFSKRSVEEGFSGLEKKFQKIMAQLFVTLDDEAQAGNIFFFTNELLSTKEKLIHYITQIFLEDPYHKMAILRGFYFTGAVEKNVLFIRDIVQEKIFQEKGIVYPLINLVQDRRSIFKKTQLGFGIMATICAIGFWRAKTRFDLQKENIKPVLHEFIALADQMQMSRPNEIQKLKYISEETLRSLTKLSDVGSKRSMFFSIFIPATWMSPYRTYLNTTIHKIVQILIVGSLYANLTQKARQLMYLQPTQANKSDNFGALIFPLSSKEFSLLKYYVNELKSLEKHIQQYNYLGGKTSLKDFDDIFMYCFGEPLPEDFKENFHRINKFLGHKDLPKIDLRPYQNKYRKVLAILLQNFHNVLFDHSDINSLVSRLKKLEKNFDPLDPDLAMTLEELRRASIILSYNIDNIKNAKELWVDQSYFDPSFDQGDDFPALIKNIQENYLFGDRISHLVLKRLNQGFDDLKKSLQKFNKFLYSDLSDEELAKKSNSEGIFIMEKALRFLRNMPIMDTSKSSLFKSIKPDEIVLWDVFTVDQIFSKITTPFDVKKVPPILVPKLKIIFEQSMNGFVKNALLQTYTKESMVSDDMPSAELESYLRERKLIIKKFELEWVQILNFMKKQNIDFTFFKDQLEKTALYFLTLIDALLEDDKLYASNGFKFWDGKEGGSQEAFGTTNKDALEKYLEAQFHRVKFLKELAEPLVVFLNSEPMNEEENNKELITKWERLIRVVNQKEKGQNAESLVEFETFVTQDMNKMTAQKVYEDLGNKSTSESSDYFRNRLNRLKHLMLEKAEIILREESIKNYNALRKLFIERIKDKFPFSKSITPDLSLTDLKAFFELYDKVGGAPEKILIKAESMKNYDQAMNWLRSLHQLREFFGSFCEGKASVPEIQIEWNFRTDRDKERNGDHVMDFTFKPNDEKEMVFIKREIKYSRWVFGDKIEIGFEWTQGDNKKDFPQPTNDAAQKFLRVSGKKASFVYDNPWALFTLLKMHKIKGTKEAENGGDIIKFEVPQDNGDKFIGYNNIKFMKAGLTPKDPKEYIALDEIPTDAPELIETPLTLNNDQEEE